MFKKYTRIVGSAVLLCLVIACGKDDPEPETPINETNCNEIRTNGIFNLIPNLDFESWSVPTGAKLMDPDPHCFWATPNKGSMEAGFVVIPQTVFRVSGDSAYSGSHAVMMRTEMGQLLGKDQLITGALISGDFEININDPLNSLKPGKKFEKRPKTISGYYMFFPVKGDSSSAYCYMTKNIGGGKTDTLGWGRLVFNEEQASYKQFSFDVNYKSEDKPDNIILMFASSDEGDTFRGQPGNTLFIDDVKVDYHE